MLSDGLAWLNEQLASNASVTVTYHRGASSVSVAAVVQRPSIPASNAGGAPVDPAKAERDFNVVLADLESVLGTTWPAVGDYFVETVDGYPRVFKVAPPAAGGPWWDWCNGERGSGSRIVIHAKQSGSVVGFGSLTTSRATIAAVTNIAAPG
jgi:hypothetical protein